jgi:hypothetical protein
VLDFRRSSDRPTADADRRTPPLPSLRRLPVLPSSPSPPSPPTVTPPTSGVPPPTPPVSFRHYDCANVNGDQSRDLGCGSRDSDRRYPRRREPAEDEARESPADSRSSIVLPRETSHRRLAPCSRRPTPSFVPRCADAISHPPLSSPQASSPTPATATPSSSPPSTTPPRSAPSPTRTASECSLSIEPFPPLHPSPVGFASRGGEGTPRLTCSFLPSFLSQLRGQLRRGEQHLRAR